MQFRMEGTTVMVEGTTVMVGGNPAMVDLINAELAGTEWDEGKKDEL